MTRKREEKEYRIINLVMEYGHRLDGCKYAVASSIPEAELRKKNCAELSAYEPFIYLTEEMGNAIVESQNNESKFSKRCKRKEVSDGYSEGNTERYAYNSLHALSSMDPCDVLISIEEEYLERTNREASIKKIPAIMNSLTNAQRRRIQAIYWQGKSTRELASLEGVHHKAIDKSIASALKKFRKKI